MKLPVFIVMRYILDLIKITVTMEAYFHEAAGGAGRNKLFVMRLQTTLGYSTENAFTGLTCNKNNLNGSRTTILCYQKMDQYELKLITRDSSIFRLVLF